MRRTVTGSAFMVLTMFFADLAVASTNSRALAVCIREGRAIRQTVGKHTELLPIYPWAALLRYGHLRWKNRKAPPHSHSIVSGSCKLRCGAH